MFKSSGLSQLKTGSDTTDAPEECKLGRHLAHGRGVLYGVKGSLWQGGGLCLPTESGVALSVLWWERARG